MYTREEREDDAKKAFAEGDLEKALTSFVRAAELCILRRASEPDEEDKDGNEAAGSRDCSGDCDGTGVQNGGKDRCAAGLICGTNNCKIFRDLRGGGTPESSFSEVRPPPQTPTCWVAPPYRARGARPRAS